MGNRLNAYVFPFQDDLEELCNSEQSNSTESSAAAKQMVNFTSSTEKETNGGPRSSRASSGRPDRLPVPGRRSVRLDVFPAPTSSSRPLTSCASSADVIAKIQAHTYMHGRKSKFSCSRRRRRLRQDPETADQFGLGAILDFGNWSCTVTT